MRAAVTSVLCVAASALVAAPVLLVCLLGGN